jgi:hypothetical protein
VRETENEREGGGSPDPPCAVSHDRGVLWFAFKGLLEDIPAVREPHRVERDGAFKETDLRLVDIAAIEEQRLSPRELLIPLFG